MNGWKEIDRAVEELDVIDTIGFYMANNNTYEYIVILHKDDQDIPYRNVNGEKDYVKFLQEVNERKKFDKNKQKVYN